MLTVAPGSTPSAPSVQTISLGDIWCYSVDVLIPPGPLGTVGFYLQYANLPIVPFAQTPTFLVADDYSHTFELDTEIGASLELVAYNQGFWPHTLYFTFNGVPVVSYGLTQPQPPAQALDLSTLGQ